MLVDPQCVYNYNKLQEGKFPVNLESDGSGPAGSDPLQLLLKVHHQSINQPFICSLADSQPKLLL